MAVPEDALPTAERAPADAGRVGVIDIGSNTVRLVVYDAPTRLPSPLFNEKAQCELGRGLAETGRLNPAGIALALTSLQRFVALAQAMGVERLDLVATAAVREASDGAEFVARAERCCGYPVLVVSGEQEAALAGHGLLCGIPDADGVLADLGGGSLDLVELVNGEMAGCATAPLGHLRLMELSRNKPRQARVIVADSLSAVPLLRGIEGRTLYATGGSLRALARVFIDHTGYPLHVIDNYTLAYEESLQLVRLVGGLGTATLRKIRGVARKRGPTLPFAALVLERLLEVTRPKRLVFSAFGMREGQMMTGLPDAVRRQDPLIAGCEALAERSERFTVHGSEIFTWMTPLFAGEVAADARLRRAGCLLSDIGWSEHPDYRAEHAFHRVLRMPFAGLIHSDRVRLALAVFIRYNGDVDAEQVRPVRGLLNKHQVWRAEVGGLALRLAHTLSGSAPGLLDRTRLERGAETLTLVLPAQDAVYRSETVERRFNTLAKRMKLRPEIVNR